MVTIDNYEEYMMLDADGELDAAGREALQAFIAANPALKAESAAWDSLKLRPDTAMVYTGKEGLLKQERKIIALMWKPYLLAAAAAVLTAAILIPVLWKGDHQHREVAHSTTPVKATAPAGRIIQDSSAGVAVAAIPVKPVLHQAQIPRNPGARIARVVATSRPAMPHAISDSFVALNAHVSAPFPEPYQAAAPQMQPQEVTAAIAPDAPLHHASGFPRIRLAAANKPAVDFLKEGLETRIAQASAAAQSIRETALVIKLGNNSLNLNF